MATTARGIVYPVVGTALTPLANHFASLATSTNTALDNLDNVGSYVSMRKTSGQSLPSGIETDITWTAAAANFGFTFGAFPLSQITLPATGDYELSATADVSQTGGNFFNLSAYLGATVLQQITGSVYPHTNAFSRASISPIIFSATSGQVVKVTGLASSAGTVSANSATLTIKRLR